MAAVDDIRFSSAEINIVVHATENEKKILDSLYGILSIPAEKFISSVSDGHWGNKISILNATIDGQVAKELILKIISLLSVVPKKFIPGLVPLLPVISQLMPLSSFVINPVVEFSSPCGDRQRRQGIMY